MHAVHGSGWVGRVFIALLAASTMQPARAASAQQRSDSLAVHRRAVRAQATFEQVRRQNLPLHYAAPVGGCDARIGRFCHWNSEDDTVKAKEPRAITRARERLLATLDSLARRSPSDGWITGQRIRYLLEGGRDSAAVVVANSCQGATWWCDALRGLALHESGAGAGADSAFARAIADMPEAERCRWTDMTPILDASHRKRFGRVGCGKNQEVAQRLWWLVDPFLSVPGNDRQAEHYARHTMARILAPARNAYNIQFANDMRDMIVRYGWARYWTRGPGTFSDPNAGAISGHEATPNYHFIPVTLSLDSVHIVDFDIDRDPSSERYSPVAADRLREIEPQVALFRRGDSVQVVAAFDVARFPPLDSSRVASALVLAPDESTSFVASDSARKGALTLTVDGQPHLMSLEIVSFDRRRAAWSRSGIWLAPKPEGAVALSDLLLFESQATHVTALPEAMPFALPGNEVKRGKIGVYWEIYGLSRSDSALPLNLTLTPVGRSALRRLGESIGLAPRASPLNIAWRETPGSGAIATRSVVLDLSLVPRGRYQLRVEARPASLPPAVTSKEIELQ